MPGIGIHQGIITRPLSGIFPASKIDTAGLATVTKFIIMSGLIRRDYCPRGLCKHLVQLKPLVPDSLHPADTTSSGLLQVSYHQQLGFVPQHFFVFILILLLQNSSLQIPDQTRLLSNTIPVSAALAHPFVSPTLIIFLDKDSLINDKLKAIHICYQFDTIQLLACSAQGLTLKGSS